MKQEKIILKNVSVHNLKNVSLTLEPNQFIVFTGVSGSGKSSLAFDTIYTEGQRRYIESLSNYAKRFLGGLSKPQADSISGISPTIAIEQKQGSKNPRSTVGTLTGIYDFLRVLYAKIATPYCPISNQPLKPQSKEQIIHKILLYPKGSKILVLAPVAKGKKSEFKEEFTELLKKGFNKVFVDGELLSIEDDLRLDSSVAHDVDIVIDRLAINDSISSRLNEAITSALEFGKGLLYIYNMHTKKKELFSTYAYSAESDTSYSPLDPQDFSFNHPSGMCEHCEGLGFSLTFDEKKIIDPEKSIKQDCCAIAPSYSTIKWGNIYENLAKKYHFKTTTAWKNLSDEAKHVFLHGTQEKWTKMVFVHPTKQTKWTDYIQYRGVIYEAKKRLSEASSDAYRKRMQSMMSESTCPSCNGSRIKPYPSAAKLNDQTILTLTQMSIEELLHFFSTIILSKIDYAIANELIKEIKLRLSFLQNVGLHYLSLSRSSPTLSGGEMQRVRLAAQIGAGLVGTTYVLDEPSIGLHDRDHQKLIQSLLNLRNMGNTVIVVEHDTSTMQAADYIVDLGPGAGVEGGQIVSHGNYQKIMKDPHSLTGQYLSKRKTIQKPKKRRKPKHFLELKGASHHNLKDVDVKIPLQVFTAVTGVSGSGKSSLIIDTLYPLLSNELQRTHMPVGNYKGLSGIEHVDKVIEIDQSPIGRTSRSNPATYIKLFDDIRVLFAQLPEAKAFGYEAGQFSFNVKEGSCPHCKGMGFITIDMDFLEDEQVVCPECEGKRFDPKTLSVTYKEKNIFDVLNLSVNEALDFFENHPSISKKLSLLKEVGLGYIKLGQPSTTLSGGEAQRIKLAKELVRPSTGNTIYILDEPTTGLHFEDINRLTQILQRLVDHNNTVMVIEHNLDFIQTVDWIIDIGMEGGKEGGSVVGVGPPEYIATLDTPTGIALKQHETVEVTINEKELTSPIKNIEVKGAEQNNLKKIDVTIPRGKITVCSGPSGSGKTSFALDTLYAEGQRRFTESLPSYAKQFIQNIAKPKFSFIEGLSPAIAIEQKKHAGNPRSTIGTITEVYDFLRLLYAKIGTAYCPETQEKIVSISPNYIVNKLLKFPEKTKMQVLAPLSARTSQEFLSLKETLMKSGFMRIRLNDTYYQLEDTIPFEANKNHKLYLVIDRIMLSKSADKRLLDAIQKASQIGKKQVVIALADQDLSFNLAFCVESTGKSYPNITSQTFSFNADEGMCLNCMGLGFIYGASLHEHEKLMKLTPLQLMADLWKELASELAYKLFLVMLRKEGMNPELPISILNEKQMHTLLYGSNDPIVVDENTTLLWQGISSLFEHLAKLGKNRIRKMLDPLLTTHNCPACHGKRLNSLASNVTIEGVSLPDLCSMPIDQSHKFIQSLSREKGSSLEEILCQISSRMQFMEDIGLSYLSLDRSAPTLSGGETQRIQLARQLGSSLTGCLYVLDEPTIGLHPHNNYLLNESLKRLKNLGNTVVLVEHDPMTIEIADKVIDFGPQSGSGGGQIVAQGSVKQIKNNAQSPTGLFLSKNRLPSREIKLLKKVNYFSIQNASSHNLKQVNVDIPYGRLSCITGVSGSGKSTLLFNEIYKGIKHSLRMKDRFSSFELDEATFNGFDHFDDVVLIDQNPIGHTARSDVSTYIDLLTPLRGFFASLPEAAMRGLLPRHFSFNHLKGMCRNCWGLGFKTIDLQFLPSVKITCPDCEGYRLNSLSLKVKYKDKHLGQILEKSADEILDYMPAIPKLSKIIDKLKEVGLGYLKLNQPVATLSCGEAQRLRLVKDLLKRQKKHMLYLFDEPTTGLHNEDIIQLLPIFSALVNKGHTVIMIEHQMDMILHADYIIDVGPLAGDAGGKIIFSGSIEQLLACKDSFTGKYCKKYLNA